MPQSPTASPTLDTSHWLVIALVGAACTIFLLFNYCRVLERHCCAFRGINFSRNQGETRFLDENNADDAPLQFQSRGLDSYVLHSLPISQFKKKNEEELSQSNTDCAVCLGEFEEGELIKHLPNCSHAFHVSCIDTWFQNHSTCPLCRSHVFDQAMHHEYSLSMYTLLETLRREDFLRERSTQYQVLRSHILQNFSPRINPENAS